MLLWILARAKERSTWMGLFSLAGACRLNHQDRRKVVGNIKADAVQQRLSFFDLARRHHDNLAHRGVANRIY